MRPVCLLTGAGGLLGSALQDALSGEYYIAACYHKMPSAPFLISEPRLDDSVNFPRSISIKADLSKRQDIRRVVDISLETFGRIDCVINTAADTRFHGKLIELWESNDYPESQLRINCIAPLTLVSAVFQECWKNNTSENMLFNRNVVNVSSISGFYAYPSSGQGFYSASKAAMNMLTLYLSLELAPYSVRANAICPARFTHGSTIQAVVKSIEDLLVGNYTGKIVSEFLPMEK